MHTHTHTHMHTQTHTHTNPILSLSMPLKRDGWLVNTSARYIMIWTEMKSHDYHKKVT